MDLAVAVDSQRKAADDVLLRRGKLLCGRAFRDEYGQRLAHDFQRVAGLRGLSLHTDRERPFTQQWRKVAVSGVRQAAFLAHFLGDAQSEAASAENVIAHEQRKVIRVAAAYARRADEDV